MREREDDMHIRHFEQLTLTRMEPPFPGLCLALRTVAVPTRVIRDGLMSAGVTPVEMAPERGRTTTRDRTEDRSLLHAQPRMLLDEGITLRVEDIGHLERDLTILKWMVGTNIGLMLLVLGKGLR